MEVYNTIDFGDICRLCLNYQTDTPYCNIFESRIEDPDLNEKDANLRLCKVLKSISSVVVSTGYFLLEIVSSYELYK